MRLAAGEEGLTADQLRFAQGLALALQGTAERHAVPVESLRPFVCHGDPLACEVFLCGINPATDDRAFPRFWNPPSFDFGGWHAEYARRRIALGKSLLKGARPRIQRFAEEMRQHGVGVLESNFDPRHSPKPPLELDSEAFRFLIDAIRPKVLVLHGADDPFVPAKDIEAFVSELKEAGVDWQMVSYGGAVHSFTDLDAGALGIKGAAYNEKADRRSWEAMKTFFSELFAR